MGSRSVDLRLAPVPLAVRGVGRYGRPPVLKHFLVVNAAELVPGIRYAGQVVGEHTRDFDLVINICKTKKLTNVRAAGTDEKVMLPPPVRFSLEEALEYIQEDELVEVTPKSMRMRKIILDEIARKRAERN